MILKVWPLIAMTVGALCFAPHQVEGSFFSLGSLTGGGNPCVGVGSGSGGIFGNGLGSGFGSGFGFMRPFSPSLSWGRLFGTSSFANPCRPAAVWMPSGSGSGWANNNNGWTSSGGYGGNSGGYPYYGNSGGYGYGSNSWQPMGNSGWWRSAQPQQGRQPVPVITKEAQHQQQHRQVEPIVQRPEGHGQNQYFPPSVYNARLQQQHLEQLKNNNEQSQSSGGYSRRLQSALLQNTRDDYLTY